MTPTETAAILRKFAQCLRADKYLWGASLPGVSAEVGAAIESAIEIIDRLEEAESDGLEQARLNGMGSEREAALMAKLEAAEKERDALLARIEAMEKQEPVGTVHDDGYFVFSATRPYESNYAGWKMKLYLAPGAQPAPIIPEGWKLVPIEPTEKMISEGSCASSLPGPHYISEGCAQQCWKYMLAATPEAKS
jgi:hypothetical protein